MEAWAEEAWGVDAWKVGRMEVRRVVRRREPEGAAPTTEAEGAVPVMVMAVAREHETAVGPFAVVGETAAVKAVEWTVTFESTRALALPVQ